MLNEIKNLLPDDLVALEIVVEDNYRQIKVIVDGEKAVQMEDTTRLARRIQESGLFENEKYSDYHLEVSTPGIGHPLKHKFQFIKNIGRKIRIEPQDPGKTIDIRLTDARENSFEGLNENGRSVSFDYNNIHTAKVLVEFV